MSRRCRQKSSTAAVSAQDSAAATSDITTTTTTTTTTTDTRRDPRASMDLSHLFEPDEVDSDGGPPHNGKVDLLLSQPIFRQSQKDKPADDSSTTTADATCTNDDDKEKDGGGDGRPATPSLLRSTKGEPSPPASSPSESSSVTNNSALVVVEGSTLTPEQIQLADERAQARVRAEFNQESYATLDDVFWCCGKSTCFPVVLVPTAERMATSTSRPGRVKVLFLGCKWKCSWEVGEYPWSFLKPFDHDSTKRKKPSTSESVETGKAAEKPEWNPKLLQLHFSSLKKQKEFQGSDRLYKLRMEESYLKMALLKIQENQQLRETLQQSAPVSISHDDDDDESEDELTHGGADDDDIVGGNVEPDEVMVPPQLPAMLPSSDSLPPRRSERARTTLPTAAAAPRSKSDAKPNFKLRAGDQITYVPAIKTADRKNLRTAFVTAVFSKKDEIVVELSNLDCLSKEQQVSVVQRWCRNKLVPSLDTRYFYLQDFNLDPSNNGKVEFRTRVDAMHELVTDTSRQVDAIIRESCSHGETSSSRKRPRDDGAGEAAEGSPSPTTSDFPPPKKRSAVE